MSYRTSNFAQMNWLLYSPSSLRIWNLHTNDFYNFTDFMNNSTNRMRSSFLVVGKWCEVLFALLFHWMFNTLPGNALIELNSIDEHLCLNFSSLHSRYVLHREIHSKKYLQLYFFFIPRYTSKRYAPHYVQFVHKAHYNSLVHNEAIMWHLNILKLL